MDKMSFWLGIIQYVAAVLIASVPIITTIITNRKKTVDKLDELKTELKADIKATNDDVELVKKSFAEHIKDNEEDQAKQARRRILRFYDELCEGREHSESHFEDILDDIDFYKSYCLHNPDFKNSRGESAMDHIQETYKRLKAKGGFLTYKGGKHIPKATQTA